MTRHHAARRRHAQVREKRPVLRAYLENWASATKGSFGVDEKATDEELRDIAPNHPVFRITS